MTSTATAAEIDPLLIARNRLIEKKLFDPATGSISMRLPRPGGGQAMLAEGERDPVPLDRDHQPTDPTAQLHQMIYGLRDDVGSIVVASPKWGSLLGQLDAVMPSVFDEQVRQLGLAVHRLPGIEHAVLFRRAIMTRFNAFVEGAGVLVLGYTPQRAVFNLELLEKCSQSFVLAHLTGGKIGRIPWWVQWIAGGRLKRDQKKSARFHAQGETPTGLDGY